MTESDMISSEVKSLSQSFLGSQMIGVIQAFEPKIISLSLASSISQRYKSRGN